VNVLCAENECSYVDRYLHRISLLLITDINHTNGMLFTVHAENTSFSCLILWNDIHCTTVMQ